MKKFLSVLLVLGIIYVLFKEKINPPLIRFAAFHKANMCADNARYSFPQIKIQEVHIGDGTWFPIPVEGGLIPVGGFWSEEDTTIYIASAYAYDYKVLAHEYIHAQDGAGHGKAFSRCKLLASQIEGRHNE